MPHKQRWSYEDDYLCCERYLYFSIGRTRALSIYALIEELAELLPHLSRGSLRMKLQNIKSISNEMKLNDGVDISPLDQYSAQCRRAFISAFNDMAKKFNRDDADETLDERDKNINKEIDKGGKKFYPRTTMTCLMNTVYSEAPLTSWWVKRSSTSSLE